MNGRCNLRSCEANYIVAMLACWHVSVFQCSALLDETSKEDFVDEIREEYEEIRVEHYDTLKVLLYLH